MAVITLATLGQFPSPKEHEIKLIPYTDQNSTTRILVTRHEGEVVLLCRCEQGVKALYPHPNGRGYVCSSCVGKIKKEMPDVKN
jgi:hypothetical protein